MDSQDFWTSEFRGLGNLVVLEVRCGMGEGQMKEVLEKSARLEELVWTRVGCTLERRGGVLKKECLEVMLRLSRLRTLVLDGWVLEWTDLWALCRANPNLRTLGLGSTRRWVPKAPFQDGDREMELLSVEDLSLKLVYSSREEEEKEEEEDNETLDLVAFLPYLKRLRLDAFTRVNGKLLIANLHKASARLAATVARRPDSTPAFLLLPPPSKLEDLEIHVHQGPSLDPTDEDNQTPYLTHSEITTLIQEHAQPQGLTRLHLHLTTISPFLTSAICAIPSSSPIGYNVLQDLEIRISDFYGHSCDPIPWIRSILATCTRLRRVYLDLMGPQAEQKVFMRFAQGLFCGEVQADEAEEGGGGGGGVVDPRKAWACAGSLEELTVLGIQLPGVVDMAGYLGWRYRKSEGARLKKVWRTNRQRLQGFFTRTRTSNSSTANNANITTTTSTNNRNTDRNRNEGEDDTSSSEEEEQHYPYKGQGISMTRLIAFEIYENLKSIGRDPDTISPDDVTYLDRLLRFACHDSSPSPCYSSSSSSSFSLDSQQQQQLLQHQRTRKQHKQKQKQKQKQKPTPPYRPSRAEMRFNAQLATQIAQCPRLIMLRLNWDTYTQELADLRARQKVLQLEQREEELLLLREKIVALEEDLGEKTTKVQQQPRQGQKQEQKQKQKKRRSFLFG